MPYNLASPNGLLEPLDLGNVPAWFARETLQIESETVRHILHHAAENLKEFICWPTRAMLLWESCNRVPEDRNKQTYHSYPQAVRDLAKKSGIKLDTRANGPAIAAFRLAGGTRPTRFGSSNSWSVHPVYSGKFPYMERTTTTHAVKDCKHFTQSAGVIATHPIADALCDEFPFFAWLVRAESFQLFGYDPDGVFSSERDSYGFRKGYSCEIFAIGAE